MPNDVLNESQSNKMTNLSPKIRYNLLVTAISENHLNNNLEPLD